MVRDRGVGRVDARAAASALLRTLRVWGAVCSQEESIRAAGRCPDERLAVTLSLENRQAVEVGADPTLEDGVAVVKQVVDGDRCGRSRTSAEHLREQVLGTLDESVELLQRSFTAGRIGATEVVTLRREFVASRRETVEALAEAWLARIELDLAVGRLSSSWPDEAGGRS